MYVFKCVYHLVCACKHLFLKEIPVLQVPEEPKKVVPEKKFPVIKKPEAPPPKGTCAKINVYKFLCCLKSEFLGCVLFCPVPVNCCLYVTMLYRLVELT